MLDHGAPLNGQPVGPTTSAAPPGVLEGGVGFDLPQPAVRQDSLHNEPLPVPADIQRLYEVAATAYGLPWTLLAGVGMEETAHGRNTATSSAGAQGLMSSCPPRSPPTVDGDADGSRTSNPATVHSAANYLSPGALQGPAASQALFAHNHADWYVGDVRSCNTTAADSSWVRRMIAHPGGNPNLPPLTGERIADVLSWAGAQVGKPYVMGANGPDAYDCSSLAQGAYARIGITMPRTAQSQRDWLAAGNGFQVTPGKEQPGDLIFTSSYLGPHQIGHVAIVWDPATHQTVEAASTELGVIHGSYANLSGLPIYEIWRLGNLTDGPTGAQ